MAVIEAVVGRGIALIEEMHDIAVDNGIIRPLESKGIAKAHDRARYFDLQELAAQVKFTLPGCILTPHIAGSLGNEVWRMSAYMADEFSHYLDGTPCRYEVTLPMLDTMA